MLYLNYLNKYNTFIKKIIGVIILLLYFPINIFLIELLSFFSINKSLEFIINNNFYFLINIIILIMLFLIFMFIFNNKYIIFTILNLLTLIIGIGTKIKIDFRGLGFTPIDLIILKEAQEMTNSIPKEFYLIMLQDSIITILILFLLTILIYLPKLQKSTKNIVLIISSLFLFSFFIISPKLLITSKQGINKKVTVQDVGSLYYFVSHFNNPVKLPKTSKKIIYNNFYDIMYENINKKNYDNVSHNMPPDIIIIQSESFYDPTIIGNENFTKDPLINFHNLKKDKKAKFFYVTVPSFNGGTSNSEFEVLTGLSTTFFPKDMTIYSGYINNPIISLASILRNQNYYSYAIHPYDGKYYRRNIIYKYMGFNKYDDIKYLMHNNNNFKEKAFNNSHFATDDSFVDAIIDHLNNNKNKKNFVLGISMQNHSSYTHDFVFPEHNNLKYIGNLLDDTSEKYFNNYLRGLAKTDESIQKLIDYLNENDKPTILFFYGDHLTSVNKGKNFFVDIGMINDIQNPYNLFLLTKTPAFIWNNYKEFETKNYEDHMIDLSFIPGKILDTANLQMPNYMYILNKLQEKYKIQAFTDEYVILNNKIYFLNTYEYKYIYDKLFLINRDILNQKKYIENNKDFWIIKDNNNYIYEQY